MTIREDIRAFVMSTFYAPLGLSDEASLLDNGIIDSTGLIEVIAFIEESYAVRVGDSDLRPENFGSVAKISAYVERCLRDAVPASGPRTLPRIDADDDDAGRGGPASAVG
jgi:acyl carrier protein